MDATQIVRIIERLEHMRLRKRFYLNSVDLEATINCLTGFSIGLCTLDSPPDYRDELIDKKEIIHNRRGWEWNSGGAWTVMQNLGMSEEAIIDELFAIEIQAWKMVLEDIE